MAENDFNALEAIERDRGQRLWDTAREQYPILRRHDIDYAFRPSGIENVGGGLLESYPPDEPHRPPNFPLGRFGVAVFDPRTTPTDIMADVTSHYLIDVDPTVRAAYQQFQSGLTPEQQQRLFQQYAYYVQNTDEMRPFETWRETTGIPAYFRGYLFNQWPQDFVQRAYTPEQLRQFDVLRQYLGYRGQ